MNGRLWLMKSQMVDGEVVMKANAKGMQGEMVE